MEYSLFADESGTSAADKCFTIGCLLVPTFFQNQFEKEVNLLIKKHNLPNDRELKWSGIKKNYGMINLIIDLTKLITNSPVSFICKVSWKQPYLNWQTNEEVAFYKSYTMLMSYCAKVLQSEIRAKIDDKSDSYNKRAEVVEIIGNHELKNKLGSISEVKKCDSKSELLIQVADLFTGAINASHNLYLNPDAKIHKGKILAIKKVAECLGWDFLHYDTFPNADINIWHFPQEEYRKVPNTLDVKPTNNVAYVTREDVL
ncbi:DUF3800 domain-containing protein [Shewanella sp. WPAGA9]|uniref:DUF3800 domain-containing protein n=1 Tax=Shewanella sp. ENK2 TaxID=2775245 RepID=UPI00177C32C3|nr:DUF3800 domain-containing protein [Shewanella sp. WPAGA9]